MGHLRGARFLPHLGRRTVNTPVQGDESNHSPVFTLPLNDLIGLPTERKIPEKMKILLDQFRIKKDCISHGEVRAESVETFVE